MTAENRLQRERKTIRIMIEMYCRGNHPGSHRAAGSLCAECQQLTNYAMQRVDKCPFQAEKSTCATCTIHCYKPDMRQRVRTVMRYAGPRMLLSHPILAIRHMLDEKFQKPAPNPAAREN
jgi:hypothetical protein